MFVWNSVYTFPHLTTVDLHPAEHGTVAIKQLVNVLTDEPVASPSCGPPR